MALRFRLVIKYLATIFKNQKEEFYVTRIAGIALLVTARLTFL